MSLRGKGPQGPFLFGEDGVALGFGFSTAAALPNWIVVMTLGAKQIATMILGPVDIHFIPPP